MMAALCAVAQNASWQFGNKLKSLSMVNSNAVTLVAQTDEGVLMVVPDVKMLIGNRVGHREVHLRLVDRDANILKDMVLDSCLSLKCYTNIIDGKLYMLYPTYSGFMREVVDLASFKSELRERVEGLMPTTIENSLMLEPLHTSHVCLSPNRDFCVVVTLGRDGKSVSMTLLDATFDLLWTKMDTPYSGDIIVTDEGVVYMMNGRYNEELRRAELALTRIDVDDEIVETPTLPLEIGNLQLVNVMNDCMVMAGIVNAEDAGQHKKDRFQNFDRVVGISYNFTTKQLKYNTQKLTDDALNVFGNLSTKKPNKVGKADGLGFGGWVPTTYGGVAVLERTWVVEYRDQYGSTSYTFNVMGAMAYAVDIDANILWQRPMRHNMREPYKTQSLTKPVVFAEGDDVYVVSYAPKADKTFDITKPTAQVGLPFSKHNTVVYHIDRQGNMSQFADKKAERQVLTGWLKLAPGSYLALWNKVSNGGLVWVKF